MGQFRDERVIAETNFGHIERLLYVIQIAQIQPVGGCAVRLAVKHIADSGCGLGLKRLVLELQFHQITLTFVSGETFLKISVTLILLSSEANELSRNTARSGCNSAMW